MTITVEEYRHLKRQARWTKGARWFPVNADALSIGTDESVLLFYLLKRINLAVRNKSNPNRKVESYVLGMEGEGFFWCTVKYLTNGLAWSEKKQQRMIRNLRVNGLLKTKTAGTPPQRFLKIDHDKLDEICQEPDMYKLSEHSVGGQNCPLQSGQKCPPKENTMYSLKNKGKVRVASRTRTGAFDTSDMSKEDTPTMSFLHPKKTTHDTPSPQDQECARLLRDLCRKRNWAVSNQRSLWAKEFLLLRTKDLFHDEDRDARVKRVFNFYLTHAQTEEDQKRNKLPPCLSGREFRRRFNWIEERVGPSRIKDQLAVEVSPNAKAVSAALDATLHWPKGSDAKLPEAVQATITNYADFQTGLRKAVRLLSDNTKGDPNHPDVVTLQVCQKLRALFSDQPDDFAKHWFRTVVHPKIAKWDAWNGDLWGFIFRIDHKEFRPGLERYVTAKGYRRGTLDRVLKIVGGVR